MSEAEMVIVANLGTPNQTFKISQEDYAAEVEKATEEGRDCKYVLHADTSCDDALSFDQLDEDGQEEATAAQEDRVAAREAGE